VTPETSERLFGTRSAFDDPMVRNTVLTVAALLVVAPLVIWILGKLGMARDKLLKDLWERWVSWLVLAPLMAVPVLLGAAYTMAAVGLLSLLCYREYARATGLFRERVISGVIVLGILLLTFASLDCWYGLFVALWPLTVALIAAVAILADRPIGYVQRVGLGVLGFMLLGCCLGHLAFFCNDTNYRRIMVWILLCVELNDIFAYICGKSFGRRKLAPHTSPNKTVGGAVGALVLTTTLAAVMSRFVFPNTVLAQFPHPLIMGLLIGALGQLGDLLLSSIKRDVGIKDMGSTFPGHGGVLDRFNSLLLVAPAIFHYVGYYFGVARLEPVRIFSSVFH
jgi:phosphatidate cytidylyltransferase